MSHPAEAYEKNGAARAHPKAFSYNSAVEASLLGAVLLDNGTLDALDIIETDDFFEMKHKVVWQAMRNLQASGRSIDVVTLEFEIEKQGKLDAIGGPAFLGLLALQVPTPENVLAYRDIVLLAAKNQKVLVELTLAAERAKAWPHDPAELLSETIGQLGRIEADSRIGEAVRTGTYGSPIKTWLGDTEPGNDPADIFDAHGLIVRAEPCIFLGDPKVGKTLIVTDMALHLAAGRKEWCGVPLYRRCRVLALLREDSERTTRRRIFQMARGAGIEHWELDGYLEIDGITPLYFDDPKHLKQLTKQLRDFDIVLIDSLSTIHNGDENSVESMAPVMNQWRDMSLTTKTAIPIIHHFRKSQSDRGGSAQAAGGVLQRARGSSIIGATTRHAVGISAGPEKGQVVIEVESNHEVDVEPFVIQRKSGTDDRGRRFLTHARIGSLRDAKLISDSNIIDPIVLAIVKQAGPEGVGGGDLRTYVREQMKMSHGAGCQGSRVDYAARRLEGQDQIEYLKTARKWRVVT